MNMSTPITLTPTKLKIRVPYVATQNPYGDAEEMHFDLQEQLKDDTDDRYTIKTKITKRHYIYTFTTVKKEHGKATVSMQDAFYLIEFFQRKRIADAGDVLKTVYKGDKLVVTLDSDGPSYIKIQYKGTRPKERIFKYGCEYILDGTGVDLETGRKDAFYTKKIDKKPVDKKPNKERKKIESNLAQDMRDQIYYLLNTEFRLEGEAVEEFISNHDKQIRNAARNMYEVYEADGELDDLENPEGDWVREFMQDILKDIDYENECILRMKPKKEEDRKESRDEEDELWLERGKRFL